MQTSPPLLRRIAVYAAALAPVAPELLRSIARAATAMADAVVRPPSTATDDGWTPDDEE